MAINEAFRRGAIVAERLGHDVTQGRATTISGGLQRLKPRLAFLLPQRGELVSFSEDRTPDRVDLMVRRPEAFGRPDPKNPKYGNSGFRLTQEGRSDNAPISLVVWFPLTGLPPVGLRWRFAPRTLKGSFQSVLTIGDVWGAQESRSQIKVIIGRAGKSNPYGAVSAERGSDRLRCRTVPVSTGREGRPAIALFDFKGSSPQNYILRRLFGLGPSEHDGIAILPPQRPGSLHIDENLQAAVDQILGIRLFRYREGDAELSTRAIVIAAMSTFRG